jgi:hypothetical protein
VRVLKSTPQKNPSAEAWGLIGFGVKQECIAAHQFWSDTSNDFCFSLVGFGFLNYWCLLAFTWILVCFWILALLQFIGYLNYTKQLVLIADAKMVCVNA